MGEKKLEDMLVLHCLLYAFNVETVFDVEYADVPTRRNDGGPESLQGIIGVVLNWGWSQMQSGMLKQTDRQCCN